MTYECIHRESISSSFPDIFTEIYQEHINLTVWQQKYSNNIIQCANSIIEHYPNLKVVIMVSPDEAHQMLAEHLKDAPNNHEMCQQITLLVDMFCTLFEQKQVGLRLTTLDRAMCPKFHVDKIPCRLVTTFVGRATQWLENNAVDRTKLGANGHGMTDEKSGVFQHTEQINQLLAGDIALLKGENWFNNKGGGLVHRSPALQANEKRLLVTLDFVE